MAFKAAETLMWAFSSFLRNDCCLMTVWGFYYRFASEGEMARLDEFSSKELFNALSDWDDILKDLPPDDYEEIMGEPQPFPSTPPEP